MTQRFFRNLFSTRASAHPASPFSGAGWFIAIALLVFTFQVFYLFQDSWTTDEPLHLQSGVEWLTLRHSPTDPFNPPLPKLLLGWFHFAVPQLFYTPHLWLARLPSLILTQALLLALFLFAKKHYGLPTAVIATALLGFEPVVLAFGHVATTDIWAALAFLLSVFALRSLLTAPQPSAFLRFWLGFNFLLATKPIYLPVLAFLILIHYRRLLPLLGAWLHPRYWFLTFWLQWAIYGFGVRSILGLTPPLPLGELANTLLHAGSYVFDPKFIPTRRTIFFDQVSGEGWWFYPLLTLLLKSSPLVLLAAVLAARYSQIRLYLSAAAGVLLLAILGRYNVGIRQLLPAFPFLALMAAYILVRRLSFLSSTLPLVLLIAFLSLRTLLLPDAFAYFNPLVGARLGGYLISDSNLNWGQPLFRLLAHPLARELDYISPTSPYPIQQATSIPRLPPADSITSALLSGKTIAISRTSWYVHDYYRHPLLNRLTPESAVNHTYFIFRISPN